jgi:hypothetical protein
MIETKPPKLQCGSAMIQMCIAALALLSLATLVIEVSHWHMTRQRVALILQRAVDATSMEQGHSPALKRHLVRQMNWPISFYVCVLEDTFALLQDFRDIKLSRQAGQATIRHNHLRAQHLAAIETGWPAGKGPASGQSIFEANRLTVQLRAHYLPKSPWIRKVVGHIPIKVTHAAVMQSHRQAADPRCFDARSY